MLLNVSKLVGSLSLSPEREGKRKSAVGPPFQWVVGNLPLRATEGRYVYASVEASQPKLNG
jgi:hypothetical protein